MSKEDKIKGYSDWVKENLEFLPQNQYLDVDVEYKRSDEYQAAMDEVHMYTSEGKNLHDDAPDSITQVAVIESKKRKATVIMEGFL